jgi:outer membrane lipoprotein-sorting protein
MSYPAAVLRFSCGFLLLATLSARADEPATADEVIAKYIEAIGGRAKLDAVKSARLSGKALVSGGLEVPMTLEFKKPDKWRSEVALQGLTIVFAYDGQTGWLINPMLGKKDAEKMPPDLLKLMREQNDTLEGPLVNYREKGHQVELVGKEDLEGSPTYKLKLTRQDAQPDEAEYYFLDEEYFLPLKARGKRRLQRMEIEYEIAFSNYKEIDGLMMAHTIHTQTRPIGSSSVVFEKVELNVDLPDERFRMPPPSSQPTTQPTASQPTTAPASAAAKQSAGKPPPERY